MSFATEKTRTSAVATACRRYARGELDGWLLEWLVQSLKVQIACPPTSSRRQLSKGDCFQLRWWSLVSRLGTNEIGRVDSGHHDCDTTEPDVVDGIVDETVISPHLFAPKGDRARNQQTFEQTNNHLFSTERESVDEVSPMPPGSIFV